MTIVNEYGDLITHDIKLKGVKVTADCSAKLTPETFVNLVEDGSMQVNVDQNIIRKDFFSQRLWSQSIVKKVQKTMKKRWLKPGDNPFLETLPFGFKPDMCD